MYLCTYSFIRTCGEYKPVEDILPTLEEIIVSLGTKVYLDLTQN